MRKTRYPKTRVIMDIEAMPLSGNRGAQVITLQKAKRRAPWVEADRKILEWGEPDEGTLQLMQSLFPAIPQVSFDLPFLQKVSHV